LEGIELAPCAIDDCLHPARGVKAWVSRQSHEVEHGDDWLLYSEYFV
jgi:hypothetical protein